MEHLLKMKTQQQLPRLINFITSQQAHYNETRNRI